MKLSTKGRYGARAMLELAFNYGKEPVLLREISERQDISDRYLERMMTELVCDCQRDDSADNIIPKG